MSKEKDQLLGHAADNDGIDEYDNALPDWWLGLFVLTVLWGIGYAVDYHLVSQRSQVAYYEAEMAAAETRWPNNVVKDIQFDAATVAEGEKVYAQNCVACHGAELKGGIGPSLVDATWIYGAEPETVRRIVTEGVPAKGMITWGPVLGPDRVAKVASFVVTKFRETGLTPTTATAPADATLAGGNAAAAAAPAASGEDIYKANCLVCHGDSLQGIVGPNLTDAVWINGGTLADIERTITQGVPEKGMVSWGPILGPDKIKTVAAWIHGKGSAPQ